MRVEGLKSTSMLIQACLTLGWGDKDLESRCSIKLITLSAEPLAHISATICADSTAKSRWIAQT